MRYLFIITLLSLLFSACNSSSDATTEPEEPVAVMDAPNPVSVDPNEVPTGDNFEIEVLNDTIKSPRKELKGIIDGVEITINYGSPAVNGRTIYGDLVPYGRVWRTGANEATRITFDAPVLLGDATNAVPAGTYALFTEPTDKNNWTMVINENAFQWGPYDYEEEKDVLRVGAGSSVRENPAERMDFSLTENAIQLHWADLTISLPVKGA